MGTIAKHMIVRERTRPAYVGCVVDVDATGMAAVLFPHAPACVWLPTVDLENAMRPEWQKLIDHRIACEEAWYPFCDAMYASVEHYERETGEKF
jgi:hypothetical protein